ncbi:MAG: recombinase family protein [Woeseia sp.]
MKVAIYARYSTDLQDKTSIAGQIANAEALAAREGLTIVATFKDAGQSGNDDQRPGYQDMLRRLKAGEFVGVVCDETSRLTRNMSELHRLVAELKFRDQFIISCDGIDTRSEASELVLSVKAAVDQMEGRKIGYRTYRSLRERHKDGHSAGGRIYGYGSEPDGEYRRRIVEPEQAEVVREIFKRYAAGESAKKIVRDFNERGVPSPGSFWKNCRRRSIGWSHTTLLGSHAKASGILRNPIYKGAVTWNKRAGKKVPGTGRRIQNRRPDTEWIAYHDESLRIVPDKLWQAAQDRLYGARAATCPENKKGRPPRYLLTGLLLCDSCGSSYVVRNGRSYGCSSHANGRDALCDQRAMLSRERVEETFLAGIKAQLLDPKVIKAMTKQIQAEARKQSVPKKQAAAKLKRIEKQIQDVTETLCEVGRSDALTAKLKALESEKRSLQRPATVPLVVGAEKKWRTIVGELENLRKYAQPDEMESARAALREIVGEVSVVEEGPHVVAYSKVNSAVYKPGAEKRT